LDEESAYQRVIAEMLKDSGIKTKIIKEYIPVINKLVNTYLEALGFYVKFELDETFKEMIKSRHPRRIYLRFLFRRRKNQD
jgi:acetyl-CoA carboxylase alpha subunit